MVTSKDTHLASCVQVLKVCSTCTETCSNGRMIGLKSTRQMQLPIRSALKQARSGDSVAAAGGEGTQVETTPSHSEMHLLVHDQ